MRFDMTSPCPECPFRSDRPGYLTPERAEEIAESIIDRQKTFTCHKTTVQTVDEETADGPNAQHCAGALILLEKLEQPNQMMRWMERIGVYDRSKLDMNAPVVDDTEQFIEMMPCESDIKSWL